MEQNGWHYYNHAIIPTSAPHITPELEPLKSGGIWKFSGGATPLLARWTTDFDCGYETEWWYCIKDEAFDINKLNSKKRYEVNKGIKNFDVRVIEPSEHKKELYLVREAAWKCYPSTYRPESDWDKFEEEVQGWNMFTCFAAFERKTKTLCSYALIKINNHAIYLSVLKTNPAYEKLAVNAAIIAYICEYFSAKLENDFYIVDGERSIIHKTYFQDYLEKYFEFRKAYCKLNVAYRGWVGIVVKIAYPFRRMLKKLDGIGLFHQVNAVLLMEKIRISTSGVGKREQHSTLRKH